MPVIALRHLPVPQAAGLCYGRIDWPADTLAIEAAAPALRAALPPWPMLSSPAQRCWQLARRLHEPSHGGLRSDSRLQEMHFGDWEGRRWDMLPRSELDHWAADLGHFAPPGGESFAAVIQRVAALLDEIATPSILVTHGGVIRALWHLVSGWPLERAAVEPVPYGEPIPLSTVPRC